MMKLLNESDLRHAILRANGSFPVCPRCNTEFVAGIGRPLKKRDAKWCSDKCRDDANSAKRYAWIKACREEGVAT